MAKRATTAQSVQIAAETEAGTAVPADRRLAALSIDINPKLDVAVHRNAGEKFDSVATVSKEWSEASAEGLATFNELPLLAAAVIGNHTVEPVVTGAYEHTFTAKNRCTDEVVTYTVEKGDCDTAARVAGLQFTELSLDIKRSDGTSNVKASGIARRFEKGLRRTGNAVQTLSVTGSPTSGAFIVDCGTVDTAPIDWDCTAAEAAAAVNAVLGAGTVEATGGPFPATAIRLEFVGEDVAQTDVAPLTATDSFDVGSVNVVETTIGAAPLFQEAVPVTAGSWSIFIDDLEADLGTTDVTPLNTSLSIGDRFNPVWLISRQFTSFADVVEAAPKATVEIQHIADEAGYANTLDAQRSGITQWVQLDAIGPEIGDTGVNYSVTIKLPTKVIEVSPHSDEDAVYAISATRTLVGSPVISIVNGNPTI